MPILFSTLLTKNTKTDWNFTMFVTLWSFIPNFRRDADARGPGIRQNFELVSAMQLVDV